MKNKSHRRVGTYVKNVDPRYDIEFCIAIIEQYRSFDEGINNIIRIQNNEIDTNNISRYEQCTRLRQ